MHSAAAVHGIPASPGHVRARARVLLKAADFPQLLPGEILVTRFASPEVVLVFDRAAGLVTDQGGRSAHAAVVAREHGIPAVVGTQTATGAIPDRSTVTLDGSAGTARVIGSAQDA
jgi:pyruvate, water dikinase